ncbi:MAG: four helix bundle protein [Rubritalea sp.]|jgi:four helix bundle protein
MEEKVKSFEDLEAYKASRVYRMFIHSKIIPLFLAKNEYDLLNQIKRSARSITANISEGYGRFHYMDNSKFCGIARGSLYETLEHTITAHDEQLITDELLQESRTLFNNAIAPLNGYINYLFRAADKSK